MTAAAFQGTYSDWKLIRTRKVVQIVFEVPLEQSHLAYEALGGMPVSAAEVWCAIARLNPGAAAEQTPVPSTKAVASPAGAVQVPNREFDSPDRGQSKTAFRDMRLPNQAGILCDTPAFQRFLADNYRKTVKSCDTAAEFVRWYCGVKSRSDIRPRAPSGDRWQKLVDEYRSWMHQPEFA